MKNNLKPTEINVTAIAAMLNLTSKQIHNMLRNKIFQQYVLDFNSIVRMDTITFEKYKDQINYLLTNLDNNIKEEFLTFILTPINKKLSLEKPLITIIKNKEINEVDLYEVNTEEYLDIDLNIEDVEEFLSVS